MVGTCLAHMNGWNGVHAWPAMLPTGAEELEHRVGPEPEGHPLAHSPAPQQGQEVETTLWSSLKQLHSVPCEPPGADHHEIAWCLSAQVCEVQGIIVIDDLMPIPGICIMSLI
jgi:hypothetical protein